MKKKYKIRLPKGMVVKDHAHVEITDDCIYVEAELVKEQKYKPEDGDFIFVKSKQPLSITTDSYIGIYSGLSGDKIFHPYWVFWMHAALDLRNGNRLICPSFVIPELIVELRPATEEEKKMFLDKLAENKKTWNADTKQIEEIKKIRWRAEPGEPFYAVNQYGDVVFLMRPTPNDTDTDDYHYYICGNYFKTREAAEKAAKQIKGIFKASKTE